MSATALAALPFFLPVGDGERFCLFHQPAHDAHAGQGSQNSHGAPARGAVLFAHPFAEELNQSRRMAALQARAFARAGYGVLQIDLHGCGDSGGDFADARWQDWRQDLAAASQWLRDNCEGPLLLWGLRLGALLALDAASRHMVEPDALLLWQPAISGQAHLNQFLRMQSTARLFAAQPAITAETAVQDGLIEVAGYALAPALTGAIRQADAAAMTPPCPVYWLESVALLDDAVKPALQPASQLLIARWRDAGAVVDARAVAGLPFWASADINACPALLGATADLTADWHERTAPAQLDTMLAAAK